MTPRGATLPHSPYGQREKRRRERRQGKSEEAGSAARAGARISLPPVVGSPHGGGGRGVSIADIDTALAWCRPPCRLVQPERPRGGARERRRPPLHCDGRARAHRRPERALPPRVCAWWWWCGGVVLASRRRRNTHPHDHFLRGCSGEVQKSPRNFRMTGQLPAWVKMRGRLEFARVV